MGPDHRKIRARLTDAEMFHYGWARPAQALRSKLEVSRVLYPWVKQPDAGQPLLPWTPGLRRFTGTHPAAAREWVASRRHDAERFIEPRRFRWASSLLLSAPSSDLPGRAVRVKKLQDRLSQRIAATFQ